MCYFFDTALYFFLCFGNKNSEDIETETASQKYSRLILNRRFLLIAFSVTCMTVIVGVEAFTDLLIDDVLQVSTNGYVTIVSSCLPAGIVCALLASHIVIRKYKPSMQASSRFVNIALITLVIVSLVILGWIWLIYWIDNPNDGLFLAIMGILLFVYGLLIGMFRVLCYRNELICIVSIFFPFFILYFSGFVLDLE